MGTFNVECRITNVARRSQSASVRRVMVDTGSECTWIPAEVLEAIGVKREKKDVEFRMANGQSVTRSVGFAIVQVGPYFTVDEVVFAEKGDMALLGARSLEGLNLLVDAPRKRLVAAGPLPAGAAFCRRA